MRVNGTTETSPARKKKGSIFVLTPMHFGVTLRAECDQVFLRVGSQMAAKFRVVHLKIYHRATGLTSPVVATQDLLSQTFIRHWVEP